MYDGGHFTVTVENLYDVFRALAEFRPVTVRRPPSYIRSTCFGARRSTWTHAHRRTPPQSPFEGLLSVRLEKNDRKKTIESGRDFLVYYSTPRSKLTVTFFILHVGKPNLPKPNVAHSTLD